MISTISPAGCGGRHRHLALAAFALGAIGAAAALGLALGALGGLAGADRLGVALAVGALALVAAAASRGSYDCRCRRCAGRSPSAGGARGRCRCGAPPMVRGSASAC